MAHRQFARAMRRKTQWAGMGDKAGAANIPATEILAAGTAEIISQALIIANAAGVVDEETTITRTIGTFTARMGTATATAGAGIAVGCGVFTNQAVAAGVGSLPDII